jgi:hypothetical protein
VTGDQDEGGTGRSILWEEQHEVDEYFDVRGDRFESVEAFNRDIGADEMSFMSDEDYFMLRDISIEKERLRRVKTLNPHHPERIEYEEQLRLAAQTKEDSKEVYLDADEVLKLVRGGNPSKERLEASAASQLPLPASDEGKEDSSANLYSLQDEQQEQEEEESASQRPLPAPPSRPRIYPAAKPASFGPGSVRAPQTKDDIEAGLEERPQSFGPGSVRAPQTKAELDAELGDLDFFGADEEISTKLGDLGFGSSNDDSMLPAAVDPASLQSLTKTLQGLNDGREVSERARRVERTSEASAKKRAR